MSKTEYYRGIEDPIQGTFKLAEEVSSKADRILFNSIFSLYFTWFGTIVSGIIMLAFLFSGKLFLFLIFLSVFAAGLVTIWLLGTVRLFLRKASFRFSAIQKMRDGPPFHKIPKGKTKTERFLKYLKKENRAFTRMLKRRPELLRKDAYIVGKKRRHHFDACTVRKPTPLRFLHRSGNPGYSLFIREYKKEPMEEDIREMVRSLSDIHQKNGIYPNRVVLLFRARSSYRGLDDEIYDWLVDERIKLPGQLKRFLNIQVVAELPEGNYEFVPFIPEIEGYLP
ncbi:MAG: hypothetical protein ACMUHY_05190 [Thermoplasmatota archaeon]